MILLIRVVYLWSFSKMDGTFLVVVLLVKSEVYSIEYDAMDYCLTCHVANKILSKNVNMLIEVHFIKYLHSIGFHQFWAPLKFSKRFFWGGGEFQLKCL